MTLLAAHKAAVLAQLGVQDAAEEELLQGGDGQPEEDAARQAPESLDAVAGRHAAGVHARVLRGVAAPAAGLPRRAAAAAGGAGRARVDAALPTLDPRGADLRRGRGGADQSSGRAAGGGAAAAAASGAPGGQRQGPVSRRPPRQPHAASAPAALVHAPLLVFPIRLHPELVLQTGHPHQHAAGPDRLRPRQHGRQGGRVPRDHQPGVGGTVNAWLQRQGNSGLHCKSVRLGSPRPRHDPVTTPVTEA